MKFYYCTGELKQIVHVNISIFECICMNISVNNCAEIIKIIMSPLLDMELNVLRYVKFHATLHACMLSV